MRNPVRAPEDVLYILQPGQMTSAAMAMIIYIAFFSTGVGHNIFKGIVPPTLDILGWQLPSHAIIIAVFKATPVWALSSMVAETKPALQMYSKYIKLTAAGLFLSAIGDFCLDMDHLYPVLFIVGLGAFLIAHVLYAVGLGSLPSTSRPFMGAAIACFPLVMLYFYLWDGLQKPEHAGLLAPVVVYMAAICWMIYTAAARSDIGVGKEHEAANTSKMCAILGALVFAASDSILAVDKFAQAIPLAKVYVMLSYYTAQVLIAQAARAAAAAGAVDTAAAPGVADGSAPTGAPAPAVAAAAKKETKKAK